MLREKKTQLLKKRLLPKLALHRILAVEGQVS
jgi:hypothetical protein